MRHIFEESNKLDIHFNLMTQQLYNTITNNNTINRSIDGSTTTHYNS